ncbi:MAG TPA: DUF4244 domain-containing protein [Propionibacteriaceae bacterium]|nr:DUF4244 domain-containing protein [Propionibacteriaceae bacterium]
MSELVPQPLTGIQTVGEDNEGLEEETTTVLVRRRDERGMVSAEWAVGLIAAVAIAGVLLAVVTTGSVKTAITSFILLVIRSFAENI